MGNSKGLLRLATWGVGTAVVLMAPIAGLVLLVDALEWSERLRFAVWIMLWPFAVAFALVTIWHMYPLMLWCVWQYLLALDWLTGSKLGEKFGRRLTLDRFLWHSRPGTSAHWLMAKAVMHSGRLPSEPRAPIKDA